MAGITEKSQVTSSMYNNKDFVYAYGWNRLILHMIGGWPEHDDNLFMKYRTYINAVLIAIFIALPQLASIQVFWGDLIALIEWISVTLAVDISLLKIVWLGARRPTIERLLKLMADDWSIDNIPEEHEEMMKMARIIRRISSFSLYGSICVFVAYVLAQILLTIKLKDDPTVDPRLSRGFLYACIFPFDTSSISVFLPLWIGQFFMTYVSIIGYTAADSFLAMLVCHQCGQLQVLCKRLERIADEKIIKSDSKKLWKKLGEIVETHEHLNGRISEIEENFNFIFLVVILVAIFTTCTQGFSTLTMLQNTDGDLPILQFIFFQAFTSYDLGHFFLYCWIGEKLMNESSRLGTSLYTSQWYNLSASEAKSILIVTNRCMIPLQITGGKFTALQLPLFTSVVKTAASYLSVLLAMRA